MNAIEVAAVAFFVGNGVRILAYVPQMVALARCRGEPAGFSMTSWVMFGVAHGATAVYTLLVLGDVGMTAIFAVNFLCCGVIIWFGALAHLRCAARKKARGKDAAGASDMEAPGPRAPGAGASVVALADVRRSRAA